MMTKEEAIKGLTSLLEVRRKYGDMQTMKEEIQSLELAIEALKQTRWIPVSERLPDHSGNYLVTIADSNYEYGQVFKISWFYPSDHRWSFKNANVLAWMPLPEPYKAESEE